MRYSIVKLYENGNHEKEIFVAEPEGDFKKNAEDFIDILCEEQFYGCRRKILQGVKAVFLCIPEGKALSVLYFKYGKFAFELRCGLYSHLNENLCKESYFKVSGRFCEGDLAEYKDILLSVEAVNVATAMVTLRKCNCFGCNEEDIPRIRVDIACLEPAEGTDHRFLMERKGFEEDKDAIAAARRKKLKVVK